jgi:hypothetical protein
MSATQSRAKPLIGQLAVSVVGLVCVFAAYNLAGGS